MTPVPGATRQEQAVRVSGALAELGVQDLVLRRHGACSGLKTRHTDLPGVLASMPAGTRLECATLGIVVEPSGERLVWRGVPGLGGREAAFERALGG